MRSLMTIPNPVLYQVALPVKEINACLRTLIEDMTQILIMHIGVGIAAPQAGESLRLFLYQKLSGDICTVINPVLEAQAEQIQSGEEGCLSIPGIIATIERPVWAVVSGLNAHGKKIRFRVSGKEARVVLHEIDHLDGILIIDKATADSIRLREEKHFE